MADVGPGSDSFANAIPIRLGDRGITPSAGLTLEAGEPTGGRSGIVRTAWYRLEVPPGGSRVLIDAKGSNIETWINFYSGDSLGNLTYIDRAFWYTTSSGVPTRVDRTLAEGFYYIQVGIYSSAYGDGQMHVNAYHAMVGDGPWGATPAQASTTAGGSTDFQARGGWIVETRALGANPGNEIYPMMQKGRVPEVVDIAGPVQGRSEGYYNQNSGTWNGLYATGLNSRGYTIPRGAAPTLGADDVDYEYDGLPDIISVTVAWSFASTLTGGSAVFSSQYRLIKDPTWLNNIGLGGTYFPFKDSGGPSKNPSGILMASRSAAGSASGSYSVAAADRLVSDSLSLGDPNNRLSTRVYVFATQNYLDLTSFTPTNSTVQSGSVGGSWTPTVTIVYQPKASRVMKRAPGPEYPGVSMPVARMSGRSDGRGPLGSAPRLDQRASARQSLLRPGGVY